MSTPNGKDLRENLLHKLRGGDRRYAHLNATTARSRQKIDFKYLNLINDALAENFLDQIVSTEKFTFNIPLKDINKRLLEFTNRKNEIPSEGKAELLQELQKLSTTKKGLEFLEAHQKEELSELGTKSLAFGYPLLLKQVRGEKDDIICAPLFLWYLDIERDYRTDTLVLSRNEDSPIVFNEMLDYYLESELKLDFSDTVNLINARIFDDGLLDKTELEDSIHDITNKLSSNFLKVDTSELQNAPIDRKAVSKLLSENNVTEMILNAGIFGIFRAGKQSIINDLKKLIALEEAGAIENADFELEQEYPFTVINTDPTQERVIESLSSHQNLIIQGPPGTGKSQTLTALITNALANRQCTLVVCEKRTAMEIIKRNLEDNDLADFVALIENVNQDRGTIVDRARAINESRSTPHYSVRTEFEAAKSVYQNSALHISRHHDSIAALTNQFGNKGIYGLNDNKYFLGKYLKLSKGVDQDEWYKCEAEFYKIPFAFNSVELDLLISEVTEAKDKVKTVHSQLRLVPSLEIARTNYQQDYAAIESYFTNTRAKIAEAYQNALACTDNTAKELKKDLANQLKDMVTVATEALELLSVESAAFDWQTLSATVSSSRFAASSHFANATKIISSLDDYEKEANRFTEAKKQLFTDMSAHLKTYGTSLQEIHKDLMSLRALGVEVAAVKASDAVLSMFVSKRKEIKALKGSIAANAKTANHVIRKLQGVISLQPFAVENSTLESIDALSKQLPSSKDLLHAIDNMPIGTLLSENAISGKYAAQSVGGYLDALIDDQYLFYEELKGIIAAFYVSHFRNTIPGYYKEKFDLLDSTSGLEEAIKLFKGMRAYQDNETDINEYVNRTISESKISAVAGIEEIKTRTLDVLEDTDTSYSLALVPNKEQLKSAESVAETVAALDNAKNSIDQILVDVQNQLFAYYKWCATLRDLNPQTQRVVRIFMDSGVATENWTQLLQALYFRKLVTIADSPSLLNDNTLIDRLISSNKNIRSLLIDTIAASWASERNMHIGSMEQGMLKFNSLYNKRGAKGQRRNSLRKIIDKDFKLFTSLFPVVICNPSSVASLFDLKKDLFDLVLFDEASQLRLEDTYTSLYRGRVKIISGDQHQMPPSNYFQSVAEGDVEEYEDDEEMQIEEMTNAESLLDYASINGYVSEMLKVHYRSDHEDLIQFSNHAFYDAKLMAIPKFISYIPIEYERVNGLYENRSNEAEADFVVEWLQKYFEHTSDLQSIGIVTLNLPQADLIKEKIATERTDNESFNQSMIKLDELGFFVKNLENVQGDERDIMILSTTFGKDREGKFKQFFGPLNNNQGYRLLNVLVTRAKHKFIIATSIPDENINRYQDELNLMGKDKKAIFYTYLAYARAVADGDLEAKNYILNLLSNTGSEKITDTSGYTESPFEEEVLEVLEQAIDKDRIILQYKVGGENFRIDMVILNKDCTKPMLAIECDGYAYHSSPQAYLYDAYRREILKSKGGFDFYSIWSTNWFHDQRNEEAKLIATIREYDAR